MARVDEPLVERVKRALVVEDSSTTRHIIAGMLQRGGYGVLEARDGVEALDLLRGAAGVPDVALVDWNMPTMDGLAFVRAVRGTSAFDRMRILMITTENDLVHVTRALDAGADEYLMKPFTEEMVSDKLALLGVAEGGGG